MPADNDAIAYRLSETEKTVREVRDRQILEGARLDTLTRDHAATKRDVEELKASLVDIANELKALRNEQKTSSRGTTALLRVLVVLVPVVPVILHLIGAR